MTAKLSTIKPLHIAIIGILFVAALLRFYNLKDSLMFQGDQGRDALVVSEIFKNHDPVFIGPVTSIGNMYLGPFYYYFMLPFLWISYPSPMGPVYAVAFAGFLTVGLFFLIVRKLFDQKTALIGTFFLAFSAGAVNLSRFSWNPNLAPLLGLLMFYYTYLAWRKNTRYWIVVACAFALLIQLHYVTLLSASGPFLILCLQLRERKVDFKKLWKHIFVAFAIFIASLTPLILFDAKHGFLNARSFMSIVTEKESFDLERKSGREGFAAVQKFFTIDLKDRASQVLFEPSFGVHQINHPLLFILIAAVLYYLYTLHKHKLRLQDGEIILAAYLLPAIVGIAVYQHQVYEHYIAYLFPLVYLTYGLFFAKITKREILLPLFFVAASFYLWNNFHRYWLKSNQWTIDDMQKTAQAIQQRVNPGEKYNIVLLSASKDLYGMNYRYFLNTMNNKPVKIENHHQAEKLFVINEEKVAQSVTDLEIYEIVVFEGKHIKEVFEMENGPEITVLSRYN